MTDTSTEMSTILKALIPLLQPVPEAFLAVKPGDSSEATVTLPGEGSERIAPGDELVECDVASIRSLAVQIRTVSPLLFEETGLAAEQYRIARTRLMQSVSVPFLIAVSSPGSGDGKTFTAVNLAVALALKSEGRTLLIDADLRRRDVHGRIGIPAGPGLSDVLAGRCNLCDAIFRIEDLPGLHVLRAGETDLNPIELLDSARWRSLAETVRQSFPHVIVDSPPLDVVADYDLIAGVCDGVLLVLRPDHTNRALCSDALERARPKLKGVLVNAAPDWFLWPRPAHGYSRYYGPGDSRRGGSK